MVTQAKWIEWEWLVDQRLGDARGWEQSMVRAISREMNRDGTRSTESIVADIAANGWLKTLRSLTDEEFDRTCKEMLLS